MPARLIDVVVGAGRLSGQSGRLDGVAARALDLVDSAAASRPACPLERRTARKQATHWQAHAATVHTWKISWKPNQCGKGSGVLRA